MRWLLLATLTFTLASFPASAGRIDPMCAPDELPSVTQPMPDLSRVFARASTRSDESSSGPAGGMEVVVARIAADGSVVLSCVDGEAGARAFFAAPGPHARTPAAAR